MYAYPSGIGCCAVAAIIAGSAAGINGTCRLVESFMKRDEKTIGFGSALLVMTFCLQ